MADDNRAIAYFSMEIAADPAMPTYSGGLGVPGGVQREIVEQWEPAEHLEPLDTTVCIALEGRRIIIRPWRYQIRGITGHTVPVYFLDTGWPENDPADRSLTDFLYGGDLHYRLRQEAVLGLGGLEILDALHAGSIGTYHMNEGHSALLALGLVERALAGTNRSAPGSEDVLAVRRSCVFTTHTPV